MYKFIFRPFFFLFNPEGVHSFVTSFLDFLNSIRPFRFLIQKSYQFNVPNLKVQKFGLNFPNPLGLAAGFDKDGRHADAMSSLGFGFIEIGTITPLPQQGNPKPRLFRLKKDNALINRMGFNNAGVEELKNRLSGRSRDYILGINIGKNKSTSQENAVDDYLFCFNHLHSLADYFVVNVSSPNTPNLRSLQEKEPLSLILKSLVESNKLKPKQKPILLKIAPDLSEAQLDDIVEIVTDLQLDGIIAANTTINRNNLKSQSSMIKRIGDGGLSGYPLKDRSTEVIRYLSKRTNNNVAIIGVGGIFDANDAKEKLKAGASLIQIYTGFIYEGPGIIKKILKGISTFKS